VNEAAAKIREINARGAFPIVSGGTGFYLKNLLLGLPSTPPVNLQLRAEIQNELLQHGAAALYDELKLRDAEAAVRIHPNDAYRITRALEVVRDSGRPLSSFLPDKNSGNCEFNFLVIALNVNRELLYKKIDARVDEMFALGLPNEVAGLFKTGWRADAPGLKAIGYREFFVKNENGAEALNGDTESVKNEIKRDTCRYAKRQITFFKTIDGAIQLNADDSDDLQREFTKTVNEFLKTRP
jgi:tRNA dimethylallyltransferase